MYCFNFKEEELEGLNKKEISNTCIVSILKKKNQKDWMKKKFQTLVLSQFWKELTIIRAQGAVETASGCIRRWFRPATRPMNPFPSYVLQRLIGTIVIGDDLNRIYICICIYVWSKMIDNWSHLEFRRFWIHVEKGVISYSIPVLVDVHIPSYTWNINNRTRGLELDDYKKNENLIGIEFEEYLNLRWKKGGHEIKN